MTIKLLLSIQNQENKQHEKLHGMNSANCVHASIENQNGVRTASSALEIYIENGNGNATALISNLTDSNPVTGMNQVQVQRENQPFGHQIYGRDV